jgi:ABC-type multidrug transport system fused ATPase/permease subunit
MKSVKMMGLSDYLFDSIQMQRIRELELSKRFRVLSSWRLILCKIFDALGWQPLTSIAFVPSIVGPMATFVIFAIQESVKGSGRLSTSQTFSSLVIITLLTAPAEDFLQSLPLIAMSVGCLERIQSFLLSESCDEHRLIPGESSSSMRNDIEAGGIELAESGLGQRAGHAILIQNAVIRPSPNAPPAINDIELEARKGSLTMVVGVVGSGKSTLLKAIAGELKCDEGYISVVCKHVAYCSQTPWLPNATVRDIVCGYATGEERDQEWYNSVLHACTFDEDLLAFPQGDDTIIGSRGLVLSGGQKQRLVCQSLAL